MTTRMRKKILLGAAAALIAIQFVRPARNEAGTVDGPGSFIATYRPPSEIRSYLEAACFDCHSDRTRYPWYAEIQPLGWMLARDVARGKHRLNLSTLGRLSRQAQIGRLSSMQETIAAGEMPLPAYALAHPEARPSAAQARAFADWVDTLQHTPPPLAQEAAPASPAPPPIVEDQPAKRPRETVVSSRSESQ